MPKPKREPTPYEQLRKALLDFEPTARCIAGIAGPNAGSELEFWLMPNPTPGRLVIIQRWLGATGGGWDCYIQQAEHNTAEAIAEVLGRPEPRLPHKPIGVGDCRVCGHTGIDCTGKETS